MLGCPCRWHRGIIRDDVLHLAQCRLFIARRAAAFVAEAAGTLRRRERGARDDIWMRSSLLPDYFQGGFHYQTDGWLSGASAKVYETSTETLFVGRQDAMQRCTLVPVSDFMAGEHPADHTGALKENGAWTMLHASVPTGPSHATRGMGYGLSSNA